MRRKKVFRLCISLTSLVLATVLFLQARAWEPGITDPEQLRLANALLAHPIPLPLFFSPAPEPGYTGPFPGGLCLYYSEGEPLESWTQLSYEIYDHVTIFIDGKMILVGPSLVVSDMGVVGQSLHICYDLSYAIGIHTATMQVVSESGTLYSYSWAFKITSTDANLFHAVETATVNAIPTVPSKP